MTENALPQIIYQDDYYFVLNKPSGITVNRADTTRGELTLQDWVEENIQKIQNTQNAQRSGFSDSQIVRQSDSQSFLSVPNSEYNIEEEFRSRGGIVHRLDKETSGIILVAKTPESFAALKKQFMQHEVEKTYIALSHGKIEPLEGEINVPVGRLEFNRKRFGVVAGGREAKTLYKVLAIKYLVSKKHKEPLSLVELYPRTGRTHQIRVHLKHINHPIFGDHLYAGRKISRDDRKLLPRVFLHASKISFAHPGTGERVNFEAKLPEELNSLITQLQINK